MKMNSNVSRKSTRGVALIIVLAMLVLLSGLIVAFMNTVTTEHGATQAYANSTTARQIADNTTNLVIGQIREATTRYTDSATWASQPGAIRVFSGKQGSNRIPLGNEGTYGYEYKSGTDDWVYKLYSSENMRVKGDDFLPDKAGMKNEIETIKNWAKTPDTKRYVDLNEPVLTPRADLSSGDKQVVDPRYPIIDPRASFKSDESANTTGTPGIVEGFAATTKNLFETSKTVTLAGKPVPALPMPAQWLYVLRDGSIMGPEAVAKLGIGLETNPIVGRTAFWVDDESAKVNMNTASEGTYWDTPVVSTEQDSGNVSSAGAVTSTNSSLSLAASQPARGEYQRYSGHPATTCLSPVLGWLWPKVSLASVPPASGPYLETRNPDYVAFKNSMYKISPYTPSGTGVGAGLGSSMGATDNPDKTLEFLADGTPKINVLTKHLYANVDEFIFQPERNNAGKGLVNEKLTPQALEKVRFFLTANSRAPELNIFNRPRVTFWPLSLPGPKDPTGTTRRTNFDNLFAFTSTIGGKPFNFVRRYARSSQLDINLQQNADMFEYLQWLTGGVGLVGNGRPIPGFGSSFREKYSYATLDGRTERNQILALIYDYMRSVNLVDTGTGKIGTNRFLSYTPFFGQGQAGYGGVVERSYDWSGQVTPSDTVAVTSDGGKPQPLGAGLRGLGRFISLSEAALVFTRAGDLTPKDPKANPVVNEQKQMQAVLLFEMVTPMPGYPAIRETFWTRVRAGGTLADGKTKLPPPQIKVGGVAKDILPVGGSWDNIVNVSSHEVGYGRGFMPTLGFVNQMYYYPPHKNYTLPELYPNDPNFVTAATRTLKIFKRDPKTSSPVSNTDRPTALTFYPYVSDLVTMTDAAGKFAPTFELTEGAIELEIWTGEAPGDERATKVQTITLRFPGIKALNIPGGPDNTKVDFALRAPASAGKDDNGWGPFRAIDQVRALEYVGDGSGGKKELQADYRLAAMRPVLNSEDFAPRDPANWSKPDLQLVHGMHWGHGDEMPGFNPATKPSYLATNGTYRGSKPFIMPVGVNGVRLTISGSVLTAPGDFDRGISKHMDGAFGGKVDEGNVYYGYSDNDQGGRLPYFRGRGIEEVGQSFFTPNRQLPSAVMFGSLPSGGLQGLPWQTLLFRPDRPAANSTNHPGARLPEDHLLLDLFHLPIIEPYAISEPFSTAGKINLNYIIAPYGYAPGTGKFGKDGVPNAYIRRDTGLRAVLKSTKITAVETSAPNCAHGETPVPNTSKYRYDIDLDNTIAKIEQRFTKPQLGLFRSASEICTVDLYPAGVSISSWGDFWENKNAQTGDNMRERPYAHIYPRVTTKSNVFTVHMRCQTIRQGRRQNGESYEFDSKRDTVLAEYRGSSIIERFVDPNDPDLKDYNYTKTSVDPYYRFRVVDTKHFSPR